MSNWNYGVVEGWTDRESGPGWRARGPLCRCWSQHFIGLQDQPREQEGLLATTISDLISMLSRTLT